MSKVIGTAPYQVPTNADLGTMAFQDSSAVNITGGIISLTGSSSNVASISTTTGALILTGGAGIGGNLYVGGTISGTLSGNAATVSTIAQTANANYYLTFVDTNNATAAAETVYTASGIIFNPANGGQLAINTTPTSVAGLTVGKVFGSATAAESFPVYFTGVYNVADTNLKQVIRTNYSGLHTSGTQDSGVNILALASVGGVGGVTTNLYNYWSRVDNSTNATVTNAFHYFINDGGGSGGPVNQYGFYVSNLTKGAANYAIYTAGTTKSYFGGDVGIGTTTPGEKLAVAGAITVSGQASANKTSAGTIDFYNADNSTRILSWGSAGVGGKISFWTGIGGSGTVEQLTIDSSGNAGLGINSPTARLHVAGGTRITGITTVTNTTAATSTVTGALQVTGGAGIGGNLYAGGSIYATNLSPVVLNDVSTQFDGVKTVFALKLDQTDINTIVDTKDLEVVLNGMRLVPYVDILSYPWLTPYDSFKGFRVITVGTIASANYLIIYNAPYIGDSISLIMRSSSTTKQKKKYPYSATTVALGD